jgi:LCP family protein required for cell wall assembly
VETGKNNCGKTAWTRRKYIVALMVSLTVVATAGALDYWRADEFYASVRHPDKPAVGSVAGSDLKATEPAENDALLPDKLRILLLGVDERPKEADQGRSDTLLVMIVDTRTRAVSILSVPRDTRVRVKGLGWDKINHAFAFGGVAAVKQTTEDFLGIRVDYYAKVDLASFGRVVDALGGLDIDIEKRMQYVDVWDHYVIDLKPGLQRLDGKSALQYVRYRDEEGDIGRVRRQQKFVKALLAEISSANIVLQLPGIIREVVASLETDLPMPLMLGLAHQLKKGLNGAVMTNMVEGQPYYIDDISYWVPDVMKTRQKIAELQGVVFSGNVRAAAMRLADEYQGNLPARAQLDDGVDVAAKESPPIKATLLPEQKVAPISQSKAPPPMPSSIKPPVKTNTAIIQQKVGN